MFQFKNALVISGSKSVNEAEPVIELNSTLNTFTLNKKAMLLLDITPGEDRVAMFDMAGQGATDHNDRFYICKSFDIQKGNSSVPAGALVSTTGKFSYNRIYGAMICEDMDVIDITPEAMVERGVVYPKVKGANTQYISKKVGNGKLELYKNGEEIEVRDGIMRKLALITNLQFTEHVSTRANSIEDEATVDQTQGDLFSDDRE